MGKVAFAGKTLVAPGVLVRSTIGQSQILTLLPFGTIAFVGVSDGGVPLTTYRFSDLTSAQRVLRGGALLNAIQQCANVGGITQFIAVVAGKKAGSNLTVLGNSSGGATLASGDQGTWTTSIAFKIQTGSTSGFAWSVQYPDPITGVTTTIGGPGTDLDNLSNFTAAAGAIAANPILTPTTANIPAIAALSVGSNGSDTPKLTTVTNYATSNGSASVPGFVPLVGGSGNGSTVFDGTPADAEVGAGGNGSSKYTLADAKAAIDSLLNEPFDIAHMVGISDDSGSSSTYNNAATVWAYADGQAQTQEAFCFLRRWIHQVKPTSVSTANSKAVNSLAVVASLTKAAQALSSKRSSVVAQRIQHLNTLTGQYVFDDAAPLLCGMAALSAATGQWGPATPLTNSYVPGSVDIDWPVLQTTGDQDNAILGGGIVLQRQGPPGPNAVTVVQSVTTAPNDPSTGKPWIFAEFSVVRVSDAVLANVKTAVELASPKVIGGGVALSTLNAVISQAHNVLEQARSYEWITAYDPKSIQIGPYGTTGNDNILKYSAAPTLPFNHLLIDQTLTPFQAPLTAGGTVSPS